MAFKEKFTKKRIVISTIILVVVLIIIFVTTGGEDTTYDTIIAERQDLKQEINATGRVEAVSQIDLAFENSGRVGQVYVSVGDAVDRGSTLLSLESGEAAAELAQARASVQSARATLEQFEASLANQKAKLDELNAGTRAEELVLYESKVASANSALISAREGMLNAMEDAYTRSEDAVRNSADQLFNSPKTQNSDLRFTTTNSSLRANINASRADLENVLILWKIELDQLTVETDLDDSITLSKTNLDKVKKLLEDISSALNDSLPSSAVSQATLDAWKVTISAARTSVNLGLTNHTVAKEKLKNSEIALIIAENELALKKAPSTPEQISAQVASIQQAEANIISQKAEIALRESTVQGVEVRYEKNILRSPISGIVTKQDGKRGAIVSPNQTVVSVITEGNFEIEAFIVEADIVGLEIGDKSTLTLDAYGDDVVFEATVVEIDPAAEQIEGVANYRITLKLSTEDERIRAGMTADIDIVTDERMDSIAIPQRAVVFRSDEKIVRVLNNDLVNEVQVETGIRGERGMIEIVSGLSEGDVVVTAVNE